MSGKLQKERLYDSPSNNSICLDKGSMYCIFSEAVNMLVSGAFDRNGRTWNHKLVFNARALANEDMLIANIVTCFYWAGRRFVP